MSDPTAGDPFAGSALYRHTWAHAQLEQAGARGPHLDVGCSQGAFTAVLAESAGRPCVGVDIERHDLEVLARRTASVSVAVADAARGLPFRDASFATASVLDVLEHVADDVAVLAEVRRVLRPGGTVVATVPAHHLFSVLDPDDAAFRFPGLHRLAWTYLYGEERYRQRFVNRGDGYVGDVAEVRGGHTNYEPAALAEEFGRAGLLVDAMTGSGLWFRWLQIPALVLRGRGAAFFDRLLRWDGERFAGGPGTGWSRRANLFVTGRRPG